MRESAGGRERNTARARACHSIRRLMRGVFQGMPPSRPPSVITVTSARMLAAWRRERRSQLTVVVVRPVPSWRSATTRMPAGRIDRQLLIDRIDQRVAGREDRQALAMAPSLSGRRLHGFAGRSLWACAAWGVRSEGRGRRHAHGSRRGRGAGREPCVAASVVAAPAHSRAPVSSATTRRGCRAARAFARRLGRVAQQPHRRQRQQARDGGDRGEGLQRVGPNPCAGRCCRPP